MKIVYETRIAASPEVVFAFHESPGALNRLIPPWESVRVESGGDSIRPGARTVLVTKVEPFSLRWIAEHVDYDPPHLFSDRQVSGPFAKWMHHHRFLDDGQGGTLLRDEIEYEVPLGAIGRLLAGRFVRRKLDRMFAFRHERTRELISGGTDAVVDAGPGAR